jgi:hypothetical protein
MTDVKLPHGHHAKVREAIKRVHKAHAELVAHHAGMSAETAAARAAHLQELVATVEQAAP